MSASVIHLVRHGEVNNPDGLLYGRLGGFGLTETGGEMALAAARYLTNRPISAVVSSPLTRAMHTAETIARETHCSVSTDDRVIEGANQFEGSRVSPRRIVMTPGTWPRLWNPFRPSWGEAYRSVLARMLAAMADVADSVDSGDVVIVSHQLPISIIHRHVSRLPLHHSPRKRRCSLCSVTSFQRTDCLPIESSWSEVSYAEPASIFADRAIDLGAV